MNRKKRKHVMNDDVLSLVLCELPIKQLLRLEMVSKQFRDCVNYALKRKTAIRLGRKHEDLRCPDKCHSIVGANIRRSIKCRYNKYDLTYELDQSLDSFEFILKKCPNIKALYLSECRINEEVIQLLVDNCKQLKCLTLALIFCTNNMEEWKRLTAVIAKLDLRHLAIVGTAYEYTIRNNCSHTQEFSPQINYLVSHLPNLEQLIAYWYADPLHILIDCLSPTIKSLHLIRCSKLSANSMSLLNSGNFPFLKNLKIDTNFYGRTQESAIFSFICANLNLESLVFYSDSQIESMDDINYSSIRRLKFKFYEMFYSTLQMKEPFLSLQSLYLINEVMSPDNTHLYREFPNLRDLTLKSYHFRCVCPYDDFPHSDTDSLFDYDYHKCSKCNSKSIQVLSKLSNLKRLRLISAEGSEADAFKHFLHLPILELAHPRNPWSRDSFIRTTALACLSISQSRKLNPFAVPLTIRSNEKFIQKLNESIVKQNFGKLPDNLFLHIRDYRNRHFTDY